MAVTKRSTATHQDPAPDSVIPPAVFTFGDEPQPAEFSEGVAAALGMLAAAQQEAKRDEAAAIVHTFDALRAAVARGGKYADGALATVAEHLTISLTGDLVAGPDLWRPLSPAWGGDNCEIPPDNCRFYEVEGLPYSVDANQRTLKWSSETDGDVQPVDSIRNKARPITREQFHALRRQVSGGAQ